MTTMKMMTMSTMTMTNDVSVSAAALPVNLNFLNSPACSSALDLHHNDHHHDHHNDHHNDHRNDHRNDHHNHLAFISPPAMMLMAPLLQRQRKTWDRKYPL